MSRTIRRKGWHVVKSSKWNDQNNNEFAYIKSYNEYVKTQKDKETQQKYVELRISKHRLYHRRKSCQRTPLKCYASFGRHFLFKKLFTSLHYMIL